MMGEGVLTKQTWIVAIQNMVCLCVVTILIKQKSVRQKQQQTKNIFCEKLHHHYYDDDHHGFIFFCLFLFLCFCFWEKTAAPVDASQPAPWPSSSSSSVLGNEDLCFCRRPGRGRYQHSIHQCIHYYSPYIVHHRQTTTE